VHPRVLTFVVLSFFVAVQLGAQVGGATLSGTVTGPSGAVLPNAKISITHVATGRATETQTDSAGLYTLPNLMPGDYELSTAAEGFSPTVAHVTITADARQTMNVTLRGGLSLDDLGFSPTQTQGSAQDQARLDRRSHMLMIHQRIGLIAAVAMAATAITGSLAGGSSTSSTGRYAHATLGVATTGLYLTSAYLALLAPKISGTHTRGPIRVHKLLSWVHGPGMIATPILGGMAFAQRTRGEKVHGIASAHGAVAIATAAAYAVSILWVSIKF
jgi:carboxypeptidase family protein